MAAAPLKMTLPLLLSLNAGFVDTAGFLALQGLFTAHVTGNFVTLGAALVLGTSGAVAKLLALPVFCIVVIASRWFGTLLSHSSAHPFVPLLVIKVLLLIVGAVLGGPAQVWIWFGATLLDAAIVAVTSIGGSWRIHSPSHWAERFNLVVMLALGESVVSIGVGAG